MSKVSKNINQNWPKDILGRKIQVGDTVAIPKLWRGVAKIFAARVERIENNVVYLDRWGKYLHSERLGIIDWEDSGGESS